MSLSPDCIDLMDEKGTLMNLSKVEDPASEYASKYLQGRQRYILIRAVREFLVQKHSPAPGQEGPALGTGLGRDLFSSHLDTAQKL